MALSSRPSSTPTAAQARNRIFSTSLRKAHESLFSSTAKSVNPPTNNSISYVQMTNDIATMLKIKDQIEKMLSLTAKVIKENETTPEVQSILNPIVNTIKTSYPIFHKSGTQYFVNFATMQESAKTNQVLSSASVRIARETFTKDWQQYCNIIDSLTEAHPPPHANEISAKFHSIHSAMDYIKMTNENRKYPTLHLSKNIANYQSLGDNLCTNIIDLFSQPNFPKFETDLLSSYITNVKSFLGIVNNAFSNEFLQSGVMLFDLSRVKSNIFTDCNEIILSLKSAFAFPVQMGEIQQLKNETNVNVSDALAKLSVPFAVVKPNGATASQQVAVIERTKNLRKLDEEIEEDNMNDLPLPIRVDEYSEAIKKIKAFLKVVSQTLNMDPVPSSGNVWDDVNATLCQIKTFKDFSDNQQNRIFELENSIRQLTETDTEREIMYTSRKEVLQNHFTEQNSKYQQLKDEFDTLSLSYGELYEKLNEKKKKIKYLAGCGDALLLKKELIEIGKTFLLNFKNGNKVDLDFNLKDEELVAKIRQIQEEFINRKCDNCENYQNLINELILKMKEDVKTEQNDPLVILTEFKNAFSLISDQNKSNIVNIAGCQSALTQAIKDFTGKDPEETNVGMLSSTLTKEAKKIKESQTNLENLVRKKEESYLKTIRQISSKLSKLLNDNVQESLLAMTEPAESIRSQIIEAISSQLRNLRDTLKVKNQKIADFTNKFEVLGYQRNMAAKRLAKITDLDYKEDDLKEPNFLEKVVELSEDIRNHFDNIIEKLNSTIDNMKNDFRAINTRLIGVSGQQINSNERIIESIYQNIEIIQDQKEELSKNNNNSEKSDDDPFKECVISILFMNDPSAREKDLDDEELINYVHNFVEEKLRSNANDYIPTSQISSIFEQALNMMEEPVPKAPLSYLKLISQTFLAYSRSFDAMKQYAQDVNLVLRTYDGTFDSLDPKSDNFCAMQDNIHNLRNALDGIAPQISNPNLLTVLYKFVSLIIKCIDYISMQHMILDSV